MQGELEQGEMESTNIDALSSVWLSFGGWRGLVRQGATPVLLQMGLAR